MLYTWTSRVRQPFWLGQLGEQEMWSTLLPGADPQALAGELESRYRPGPLFDSLDDIDDPVWLLSNRHTEWLLPRLARLGLADRFERVYVSDAIGFVKPDVAAFRYVQRLAGARPVRYVDDKPVNVAAAATVFAQSVEVGVLATPNTTSGDVAAAGASRDRALP